MSFSEILTIIMRLAGVTDEELMLEFDMSRQSINRWRHGKTTPHEAVILMVYVYIAGRLADMVTPSRLSAAQSDSFAADLLSDGLPPHLRQTSFSMEEAGLLCAQCDGEDD